MESVNLRVKIFFFLQLWPHAAGKISKLTVKLTLHCFPLPLFNPVKPNEILCELQEDVAEDPDLA